MQDIFIFKWQNLMHFESRIYTVDCEQHGQTYTEHPPPLRKTKKNIAFLVCFPSNLDQKGIIFLIWTTIPF